jgi:predicted nucleic acid-binding protein
MAVLLDSGPWVALLSRNDTHHRWALEQFRRLPPPFLSCEAVVAETCFLRYENVPASLADAALIRLSEITDAPLLLTTDSDFHIYRRHGRQTIPLIRP